MHWFLHDIKENALDVWRVLRWILAIVAVFAVIQFGHTIFAVLLILTYHAVAFLMQAIN